MRTTSWRFGKSSYALLGLLAWAIAAPSRGGCDFVAVSAGTRHSLVLMGDGTVMSWGENAYGQLGLGTTTDALHPVTVSALIPSSTSPHARAVAAGGWHSLALMSDGTVRAWGFNGFGELGLGDSTSCSGVAAPQQTSPQEVVGASSGFLHEVVAVAAGSHHSLALLADGTVWSWGANRFGQLGNGSNTSADRPVQVTGLTHVVAIAAGHAHSLALTSDGTVYTWGYNAAGQLGWIPSASPTPTFSNLPGTVPGIPRMKAIAAGPGGNHSLALTDNGLVWSWGWDLDLQTGVTASAGRLTTPMQVVGLGSVRVRAIAAGSRHSLALTDQGSVFSWGGNAFAQLGRDTGTADDWVPTQIAAPVRVSLVAAGGFHSLALATGGDGQLYAWGGDSRGQLGDDCPGNCAGTNGCCIDLANGRPDCSATCSAAPCCGLSDRVAPMPVKMDPVCNASCPKSIIAVAGGTSHSVGLTGDGRALGWGGNSSGQLGNGTTQSSNVVVGVDESLSGAIAVAAGSQHSLALRADGAVFAWGAGGSKQLGVDCTTGNRTIPTQVFLDCARTTSLQGVISVAAGSGHSLALTSDGTVLAWGDNTYGQLGNGTTTSASLPGAVGGITGVVIAIGAGRNHSLAVTSDGKVWAWGRGTEGELGNGSSANSSTPVQVITASGPTYLQNVTVVAGGLLHSVARLSDGTMYAWGDNTYGQLGIGSYTSQNMAKQVIRAAGSPPTPFACVRGVAAGSFHSVAVREDTDATKGGGQVWAWGRGDDGQLGNDCASACTPAVCCGTCTAPTSCCGAPPNCGINTMVKSNLPVQVFGTAWTAGAPTYLTDQNMVGAGDSHSLATSAIAPKRADNTVAQFEGWGKNDSGQLGIGPATGTPVSVPIPNLDADFTLTPGDQGNVLSAVKCLNPLNCNFGGSPAEPEDVFLSWANATATKWNVYRGTSKMTLGTGTPLNSSALTVKTYIDTLVIPPPPSLYFYRLKGVDPLCGGAGP